MKNEFKVISDLIEDNKKVLDVGCADGTLMQFLKENKNINVRGLEISKEKVQECIAKGLTVIEGNAEKDLKQFPDKSFDYVVLSQTLQAFLSLKMLGVFDSILHSQTIYQEIVLNLSLRYLLLQLILLQYILVLFP